MYRSDLAGVGRKALRIAICPNHNRCYPVPGYRITPIVVWADCNSQGLTPNPSEVASIHTASFSDLAKDDVAHFDSNDDEGTEVLSLNLTLDQIFAPTAAVLYQFREVILMGRETRVSHYDQPRFAWK